MRSARGNGTLRTRALGFGLGALAVWSAGACSAEDGGSAVEPSQLPNLSGAGGGSSGPGDANEVASGSGGRGVAGFNRPPGMPIGRGAPTGAGAVQPAEPGAGGAPGTAGSGSEVSQGGSEVLVIPPIEPPVDDEPPCSGCVELNVDVDDVNQRDDFVFNAGGVAVTRVVWTIIVPFNSDQLFVQPFVDSNYGTFTDLDANAFPIGTPVELVHAYTGSASTVGLAIGSSGAWTGNMTMSVFVDSVRLEGADPAVSPTFDGGVQGLGSRSAARNPRVVFHP